MKTRRTQILRFYIANQDGREEGDKEYDTYEKAEEVRLKLPELIVRSTYVACYWRNEE